MPLYKTSKANDQHITDTLQEVYEVPLAYNINQSTESNTWDSEAHPISIFGTIKFLEINPQNMYTFLLYMANFIRTRKVVNNKANDVPKLKDFDEAAWNFISSIYNFVWDSLPSNKYNNLFRSNFLSKFTSKPLKINLVPTLGTLKSKATKIIKLPSPISAYSPKEVLEKSKFFNKRKNTMTKAKTNIWQHCSSSKF